MDEQLPTPELTKGRKVIAITMRFDDLFEEEGQLMALPQRTPRENKRLEMVSDDLETLRTQLSALLYDKVEGDDDGE